MQTIVNLIINTPWWVGALFVYLVYIGIKASKPQIIYLKKLFAIPIIFTVISIYSMTSNKLFDTSIFLSWIIAVLIGAVISYLLWKRIIHLNADKKHHMIETSGGWATLVLILCLFFVNYLFGAILGFYPDLKTNVEFYQIKSGVGGLLIGLFIGRALVYLYKYYKAPHTDLKSKI